MTNLWTHTFAVNLDGQDYPIAYHTREPNVCRWWQADYNVGGDILWQEGEPIPFPAMRTAFEESVKMVEAR